MKPAMWYALALMVLGSVLTSPVMSDPIKPRAAQRTYKIGTVQWIAFSPLNVAEVKGFWREQGVNVEVIAYDSNRALNTALEHREIDMALDMIGSWAGMYVAGVPMTILGETDWSNGGDKIIAKQGVDIHAMKGHSLGIYLDLLPVNFFLSRYLTENNLTLSDFKLVEGLSPRELASEFIAGEYNVIINYDPQAQRAVQEGNGHVVATSADFPGSIPEGFAARSDVLATMPHTDLVKIFKGWIRAVKWLKDPAHWLEYQTILNEKTFAGSTPFSEAELQAMLGNVIIFTPAEQLEKNKVEGELYSYLRQANQFVQENKISSVTFTPGQIFDSNSLLEALTTEPLDQ